MTATDLSWSQSIAFRLPLFFILTIIIIAVIAATSVSVIVNDRTTNLTLSNFSAIANTESDQIVRLLEQEIRFLERVAADSEIIQQTERLNGLMDNRTNNDMALYDAQWRATIQPQTDPESLPNSFIRGIINSRATAVLRTFADGGFPGQNGLLLVNKYGGIVGGNYLPPSYDQRDKAWFQALESGQPLYIVGRTLDRHTPGVDITEIAVPVLNGQGELIGYLRGAFDFSNLKEIIERGRFNISGRSILTDNQGRIVYTVPFNNQLTPYNLPPPFDIDNQEVLEFVGDDQVRYLYKASSVIGNMPAINDLNWFVATIQPRNEALAPVYDALLPSLLLSALIGLLAVTALYLLYVRPLTRDLGTLQQGSETMRENIYAQPVQLQRRDELGELAATFNHLAQDLRQQIESREHVIAERTLDLRKRANQLEASMQIGRAANSSLELDRLLRDTVNLIRDRSGYYHASVFLLDETATAVVVRESTGEVGEILKNKPHTLLIGSNSVVGQATAQRKPFLARDVGAEQSYFDNPLLPETRSEVALPLISQGQLLGALDVQSRRPDAFLADDLNVLQQMADHVAAAIYNARLFTAVQRRNQRQRQVIQLWQSISVLRQPVAILQRTATSLVQDFGYTGAYLGKLIGNEMVVQATASQPDYDPMPLGVQRTVLAGPLREVVESRETRLFAHDSPNDPTLYELNLPFMRVELVAPIMRGSDEQTVTHMMVVYEDGVHKLDVNDEILLALLSEALAAALANADLLNEKDSNLLELNRLYQRTTDTLARGQMAQAVFPPIGLASGLEMDTAVSNALVSTHRVPLVLREQVIGEIVVEGAPQGWTTEMETLTTAVAQETAYALENSELFAQTQVRLREQETLFNLTNQLTRVLDINEIYRHASRAFVEELGARGCIISSWEKVSQSITLRVEYIHNAADAQETGHYARQDVHLLEDFPHRDQILTQHQPQLLTADQEPQTLTPAEQTFLSSRQAHQMLELPLLAGDTVLGFVTLYSTAEQPLFDERDIRFAQAMAIQTAVSLQNTSLTTRAQEQVTQLNTLNRISRNLSAAQKMRDMYETIRRELLAIVNATGVSISLITPDGQNVRWSYLYEHNAEIDLSAIPPVPLNKGLTGHVLTTRKPLLINSRTNLDEFRELTGSFSVGAETNAWLGVPVIYAGTLIGSLVIENETDASAFDEPEVELMTTVAANLAVAINNLRQVQELQTSRATAEMLYQTGQRISRTDDSAQVLAALAETPLLAHTAALIAYVFEQPWHTGHKPEQLTVHTHWVAPQHTLPAITVSSQVNDWQNAPLLRHANRLKPLLIADIQNAPQFVPPELASQLAPTVKRLGLFPLIVGRGCVGLLMLLGTEAEAWDATTIQDMTSLIGQAAVTMQNRRLLDRTQTALEIQRQQSVQLQTAAEVAAVSSSFLEVDELLNAAVSLIKERFDLYYVGIFFPDEERTIAQLRAGTGKEGQRQLAQAHKLPLDRKSLVGGTMLDGQPRIRQDVNEAVDWFANPNLPETKSEIALPLLVRQRTIGALTVQSRHPYAFSPELVRVLQTMSDQVAIAIDNASLFERLQGNLDKTAELYEAARQLITAVDEREVYDVLVNFSQRTNLFDVTFVLANDPEAVDQITLLAYSGPPTAKDKEPPAFSARQDDLLPLLSTAEQTTPHMILRPAANEELADSFRDFLASEVIEAAIFIPVFAGDSWLATLVLARHLPRLPQVNELQPFQTLCNQAAVTIANQRLLRETSALYQLGRSLSSAITQEDMARATAREIVNYIGLPQVRVVFYKKSQSFEGLSMDFVLPDGQAQKPQKVLSDRLYDELMATRQPVLLIDDDTAIIDPEADERLERYLRPFGVRAALCVPAFSQHQMLLGAVILDSFNPTASFTDESINFTLIATDQFVTSVENIIFFDEALARAQQLITLNQIGARISGTLDSGELARLVYQEVAALMPCDLFYLAEYDALERTYKTLLLEYDPDVVSVPEILLHGRVDPHNPLLTRLQEGETAVLPQVDALTQTVTALYNPTAVGQDNGLLLPSTIFLPMHQNRQPAAFMIVQAGTPFAYTAEEVNLLRAISNQTVLALANARLLAETQENVTELRTLFNITQSAATSVDADERIANMVNTLHFTLGEAKVELLLLDETYQELEVTQSRGFMAAELGTRFPAQTQDNLFVQAMTTKAPRLISDWSAEPSFKLNSQNPTRSQMVMPLALGQRIVGVLNVESRTAGQFDDRDLRLLQTLSVSLAATIESGRLFRDIQNANEQLRELDKMKTQFLANMSHELRTPLNSIIGFSRLILKGIDGPINETQEEDLNSIHNSGQHLLNLINDVLDLAKMDAGKMALVFDEVDLVELATSVQSTARGLIRDDQVNLRWEVAPGLPKIEADPVRLRQILLNLLSNAAKFTEDGSIALKIQAQGDQHVQISVQDTGIGIAEADYSRLFTAFEQVDANPSRAVGGTGLGLPIVRELVQLHHGRVWFESQVGRGTTFFILLPTRQPRVTAMNTPSAIPSTAEEVNPTSLSNGVTSTASPTKPETSHQRNTLLLVDDELGILTLYQRYLYDQPFELISVRNGSSALLILEERADALAGIIMDVFMPNMSGWDVLRTMRENPAYDDIPVLLCSIEDNREKAVELGAQAMLPKPIIADDLIKALRQLRILA